MNEAYHIPVLKKELIDQLRINPSGVYVDCTFGGGGHSGAILEKMDPGGTLVAFDQDKDASLNLPADPRILFIPQNFRYLSKFLRLHKIAEVDGIIADLGVSSYQFDEAERGFSTRFHDSQLDMRMDQRQTLTASDVINHYSEQELHKLFEQYGEVTNARTLAQTIVRHRQQLSIHTVNDLKQAVAGVVKGNPNKYFAQVFQALRITVNEEMEALREMLQQSPSLLRKDGRIAIITFHSIEDRIVKRFFRSGNIDEAETDALFGTQAKSPFRIITKKPIVPSEEEIAMNPRSRSAKLRVAEKI